MHHLLKLFAVLVGILFPTSVAAQDLSAWCAVTGGTSAGNPEARPASIQFFCPAGWIRTERRAGEKNGHVQVNYSMPGAPQYSLNVQYYPYGEVVRLWSGTSAIHLSADGFIREISRDVYTRTCWLSGKQESAAVVSSSQERVLSNGRWNTFRADITEAECLGGVSMLGNLLPMELISEVDTRGVYPAGTRVQVDARLKDFSNTRHEYAVLPAQTGMYVLVYAAPSAHFNERMFAAIVETADLGTAKVEMRGGAGTEVAIDGEAKGRLPAATGGNPKAQTTLFVELPVGLHTAKFRAAGFDDLEMDLEVPAGGRDKIITATMQPAGTTRQSAASVSLTSRLDRLAERPFDRALRIGIIRSVLAMKTPPTQSAPASANADSAEYVLKTAESETYFLMAAKYFETASLAAPWLSRNYLGAATAYRKIGLFGKSARQLELYLIAAPAAKDAREIRRQIASLDATTREPGVTEGASADDELKEKVVYYQRAPDDSLLHTILRLAATMNPKPAVPPQADELAGRAVSALKSAVTQVGYADAVNAYHHALRLAPWVAEYHFNLGVAHEKAGNLMDAVNSFAHYLMVTPEAEDAREVRARIGALKYAREKNGALIEFRNLVEGVEYVASECSNTNTYVVNGCTLADFAGRNWYSENEPGSTKARVYRWQFREDAAYLVANGAQEVLRVRSRGSNVLQDLVWEARSAEAGGLGGWVPAPFVELRPVNIGGAARLALIVGHGMSSKDEPRSSPSKLFKYTMYQVK